MVADQKTPKATTLIRYVAFLRGINMIGHKLISMSTLVELFTSLGLQNVQTYLATGNVLFESEQSDLTALTFTIEKHLKDSLGYEVNVFLRTIPELQNLLELKPFEGEQVDNKNTKAFVTFLRDTPYPQINLPFLSPKNDFRILGTGPREVFSLRYALGNGRFGDAVSLIEKAFGVPTTSRNYNTVVQILRLK